MAVALSSQPICLPKVWLTASPGVVRVDGDFDAQREAAEAHIKSQAELGE